jgi:hypothetical protein
VSAASGALSKPKAKAKASISADRLDPATVRQLLNHDESKPPKLPAANFAFETELKVDMTLDNALCKRR